MSPRKRVTFWLDDDHTDALKAIKARDGIPEAEQLRRALDMWIAVRQPKRPPNGPLRTGRKKGNSR